MRLIQVVIYLTIFMASHRAFADVNTSKDLERYLNEKIQEVYLDVYLEEAEDPLLIDLDYDLTYFYKKGYLDALLDLQMSLHR